VDIDAGDALVEAIKPMARSTSRAGTMGGLGGFGALFDLKAAGFADPVWSAPPMASAPSCASRSMPGCTGRSASTWSPCA
jgi:hypothetical protein